MRYPSHLVLEFDLSNVRTYYCKPSCLFNTLRQAHPVAGVNLVDMDRSIMQIAAWKPCWDATNWTHRCGTCQTIGYIALAAITKATKLVTTRWPLRNFQWFAMIIQGWQYTKIIVWAFISDYVTVVQLYSTVILAHTWVVLLFSNPFHDDNTCPKQCKFSFSEALGFSEYLQPFNGLMTKNMKVFPKQKKQRAVEIPLMVIPRSDFSTFITKTPDRWPKEWEMVCEP